MSEDMEEVGEEQRPPSVRRTFTLRNNAARQVAINFMPSRNLPYNTLRLRRSTSEHNALLEEAGDVTDAPDDDKRAEIIVREMEQHQRLMEDNPAAEELRREALRDLPQGLTMKRNVRAKLSASVSLRSKNRPISMWKRLKYRISFGWKRLHDRLRDVIFSFEFWYEPIRQVEGHLGTAVGSYFHFLRWLFVLDLVLAILVCSFIIIPQGLHDQGGTANGSYGFLDFLSGKDRFEQSLLFYGHYHGGDIAGSRYYMPYAYLFTMCSVYLLAFAALCHRTAKSYRNNFISASGGLGLVFANKVFCGWDFGLVAKRAAALHARSVYNEFQELLNEQNKKQSTTPWYTTLLHYTVNTLVTVFALGVVLGVQLALWQLLSWRLQALALSACVCAALVLCPLMFHLLVKLEYYQPRTALYVTLARSWLLDTSTLLTLLFYWASTPELCWETSLGQEMYRLVLLDVPISLVVLPAFEFARAMMYKLQPSATPGEFNIAYNSLTLTYNQALLWMGVLFCPMLAVMVPLKMLLLFHVKRASALHACRPARKVWRAAQTQTVLYMLVTLSLFTTLFALGSIFFKTSPTCGPLVGYDKAHGPLSEGVLRLSERKVLASVLSFIARPGVLAFVLLGLGVSVYVARARAQAQRSMAALLRHMVVLQARDKDFLLAAIQKVASGEWLYSPKPTVEGPDSHTWKYLREVRKPSNSGFHFDASRLSHSHLEGRPRSYVKENRVSERRSEDGDTDSSFSWQGSSNQLNRSDAV